MAALKKGEIDFADNIPADLFNSLKGQENIAQNVASPTTFDQMSFNMLPLRVRSRRTAAGRLARRTPPCRTRTSVWRSPTPSTSRH